MSRLNRAIGLARSLAIYHGIPTRQRQLRRLYAGFARPGDLVFDIGAHAGNHTRAAAALGCRVVAVEPQPDFARLLRGMFGRAAAVTLLECAVGAAPGRAVLAISDRTPTVTTLAAAWRGERSREAGFARVRWNRQVEVDVVTLDTLIARFGRPVFVKLDVEGSEPSVLEGLTQPVRALSFEYLPDALHLVDECLARLSTLAPYEFNWSPGESHVLAEPAWMDVEALRARLREHAARRRSGDVYARLLSVST